MPTARELPCFPEEFNFADYCLGQRIREGLSDKPAVRFGARSYRYAEVEMRSRAFARYLAAAGLREQRVLVVLPDVPPFVWSIFATLYSGNVLAMGNPAAPDEDLLHLIEYTGAAVLVTNPSVVNRLARLDVTASVRLTRILLVPEIATGEDPEAPVTDCGAIAWASALVLPLSTAIAEGHAKDAELPTTHRDEICVWLFTSGSTGQSKAAMHTHRDFAFNTEVYAKSTVGYAQGDVCVSVPRLFFGYATGTNLWFPFAVGATVGLYCERPTAESLAQAVEQYGATVVTNVPTLLGKLLEYDDARRAQGMPALNWSSVRFQLSAGEALPEPLLRRAMERFGCEIYDGIGSAEMFHIYASNRPGDIKPGSLGRVVDGYELRILAADVDGPGAAELPPNEVGVLWVKGDSVALGYHNDREKSWRTFFGHWCRTGDLFRRDAEGYLWFCGRADEMFKCGGLWVSPTEVEECLMAHSAVAAAAIIPADDQGLLKPKAFVVLRDTWLQQGGARESIAGDLQAFVQSRLAKHKYPRWVEVVDDLPKNDRGKTDRAALRLRFGSNAK